MFIKYGCMVLWDDYVFIKYGCMVLWDDYVFIKYGCMVLWDDCMFSSRSPHHISVGLFGFAHILIMHKIVYL